MAKKTDDLIRTLWPLPGGNARYFHTLDRMLKWAANTPELTQDKAKQWLMSQYNVAEGGATSYLRVVITLGVLESHRGGKLTLASFGKQILDAEDQAKALLVVERFMRDYLAFPEVLAVYAQAQTAIHTKEVFQQLQAQFPRWTTQAQFAYRATWLLSLGCLRQVRGSHYEIAELGKEVAARFPPTIDISPQKTKSPKPAPPIGSDLPIPKDILSRLIAALEQSATDSQAPERLEQAVAEAFGFLGFSVDQLGEAGNTDVLARADIGPNSYVVIVDAKSRRDGKLQNLEVYTLQDHLQSNEANYAVVVAGKFAKGKVARHAKDNGVVLLSVPLLCDWLSLHARTPLNLKVYRAMFDAPGLMENLPPAMIAAAEQREQWAHLLVDLLELIQETYTHGLSQMLLPADQLFAMLVTRLRGVHYPKQQVYEMIDWLTHPVIEAALGDSNQGISLAMNRQVIAQALRALADQIETVEAETEVQL